MRDEGKVVPVAQVPLVKRVLVVPATALKGVLSGAGGALWERGPVAMLQSCNVGGRRGPDGVDRPLVQQSLDGHRLWSAEDLS
jgi:hypothetical protein